MITDAAALQGGVYALSAWGKNTYHAWWKKIGKEVSVHIVEL